MCFFLVFIASGFCSFLYGWIFLGILCLNGWEWHKVFPQKLLYFLKFHANSSHIPVSYLMITQVTALHFLVALGASHLQNKQTNRAINLESIYLCATSLETSVPERAALVCAPPAALWERPPHSRGRHTGSVCSASHVVWSLTRPPLCGFNEGGKRSTAVERIKLHLNGYWWRLNSLYVILQSGSQQSLNRQSCLVSLFNKRIKDQHTLHHHLYLLFIALMLFLCSYGYCSFYFIY